MPAKQLDVVETVEERHDDHPSAARHALERVGELGRLRRDPQDVHRSVEPRGGGHLGVEVAEQRALDMNGAVVARKRLLTHHQQNAAADACERGTEEGADAARAEHGVSKHGATLTAVRGDCAGRAGRRARPAQAWVSATRSRRW